jgi:hypothetical protein
MRDAQRKKEDLLINHWGCGEYQKSMSTFEGSLTKALKEPSDRHLAFALHI